MRSDDLKRLVGRGAGVNAKCPSVAVRAQIAVDGVGHATFFADGFERAANSCPPPSTVFMINAAYRFSCHR